MVNKLLRASIKGGQLTSVAKEFVRYFVVGGGTYLVDLSVFIVITTLAPSQYFAGNIAGRISGALVGFVMHKYWTFGGRQERSGATQVISYATLLSINIALSSALLYGLTAIFQQLSPIFCRLMVDVIVIGFTFICSKQIFR